MAPATELTAEVAGEGTRWLMGWMTLFEQLTPKLSLFAGKCSTLWNKVKKIEDDQTILLYPALVNMH